MTDLGHLTCGAAALALLVATAPSPANATPVWTVPSVCKHGVSGDEFEDPPVVEYYVDRVVQDGAVSNVTWSKGAGKADIWEQPDSSQLYLVAVTYTPFLVGTMAPKVNFSSGRKIITRLPPAGVFSSAQDRVLDTLTVTINDLSGHPMPGATVLWEGTFVGSDPYTTIADNHAQVTLDCVQNLRNGYSVYVISADGKTEFPTTVTIHNSLTAARGGKSSRQQTVGTASN